MEDSDFSTELRWKCGEMLDTTPTAIIDMIVNMETKGGAISADYIRPIAEKCLAFVVDDLYECADHKCWGDNDVRLAFGRALYELVINVPNELTCILEKNK